MEYSSNPTRQPPRVAFVSLDLWVGGGSIFILKLASELIRRGIPCHVFGLLDENSLAEDFARLGIPVSCGPGKNSIFEDRIAEALAKIRDFSPTTVIVDAGLDVCELLRYLPPDVQRICVFHLALEDNMKVAQRYRDLLDCAVAVSEAVKDRLKGFFDEDFPIHQIELGVSIPSVLEPRKFPRDTPLRILYLGRLEEPAKRVRFFPLIYKHLKASGIPFRWTIAGDGPEREFLERQMQSGEPIQTTHFCGIVPYFSVPELLAEHDVILLTSDSESFCLSLHEAMAAGLVPVASAIPGRVSEVVTAKTGLSVPPEQPEAYAEGIIWLHEHRAELEAMSLVAREMICREASVGLMADRWLHVISKENEAKIEWPDHWTFRVPINAPEPWRFWRPVRVVRRILAKFRR